MNINWTVFIPLGFFLDDPGSVNTKSDDVLMSSYNVNHVTCNVVCSVLKFPSSLVQTGLATRVEGDPYALPNAIISSSIFSTSDFETFQGEKYKTVT